MAPMLADSDLEALANTIILADGKNAQGAVHSFFTSKYEDEHQRRSAIDLFLSVARYCLRELYRSDKLSAAFKIIAVPWSLCIETPHDNFPEALAAFEAKVVSFSVHRPPMSEGVFSLNQAQLFVEFVTRTFFAHFKLYKYVNTKLPRCQVTLTTVAQSSISGPKDIDDVVDELISQQPELQDAERHPPIDPAVTDVEELLKTRQGQDLKAAIELSLREKLSGVKSTVLDQGSKVLISLNKLS
eukprot:TRINITY_DN12474_c0_g1_i1.p1 TRINITY_DN12474_c0_g1~~TRINITY_DN12474_c0_g1_i1.p1  ORF type:complete len:243 (+),score=37.77 TRINITY_DN12474_c0_g1_i1:21-749(+)